MHLRRQLHKLQTILLAIFKLRQMGVRGALTLSPPMTSFVILLCLMLDDFLCQRGRLGG